MPLVAGRTVRHRGCTGRSWRRRTGAVPPACEPHLGPVPGHRPDPLRPGSLTPLLEVENGHFLLEKPHVSFLAAASDVVVGFDPHFPPGSACTLTASAALLGLQPSCSAATSDAAGGAWRVTVAPAAWQGQWLPQPSASSSGVQAKGPIDPRPASVPHRPGASPRASRSRPDR